jgi:hypothetical protein
VQNTFFPEAPGINTNVRFAYVEMSADGIRKREPCAEPRGVLPEAGEDYEGSEMEALGTMTAAKFDVVDNKVIDLKSNKYKSKCFR